MGCTHLSTLNNSHEIFIITSRSSSNMYFPNILFQILLCYIYIINYINFHREWHGCIVLDLLIIRSPGPTFTDFMLWAFIRLSMNKHGPGEGLLYLTH